MAKAMITSETLRRKAQVIDVGEQLAEKREQLQRQTDLDLAREGGATRARQAYHDGRAESPDGRGVDDVLAEIADSPGPRDTDAPKVPYVGPGPLSRAADPVQQARAQRTRRRTRQEGERLARQAETRRSAWIATAADVGRPVNGMFDSWVAMNLRRSAG